MPKVEDDDLRHTLYSAMYIEQQLAAYCLKIVNDDDLLEALVRARDLAGGIVGGLLGVCDKRRKERPKFSQIRTPARW